MKAFHSLNQQLEKWRRNLPRRPDFPALKTAETLPTKKAAVSLTPLQRLHGSRQLRTLHPPLMLGVVIVSLTGVVGYRFYNQPQLAVGTVSPTTIVAPRDGNFPDLKTTEEKRKKARTGITPILQRDGEATEQIQLDLQRMLGQIEQLRNLTGPFPWFNPQLISSGTQQYLRACSEAEWQAILAAVNAQTASPPKVAEPASQRGRVFDAPLAIAELVRYRQQKSPSAWADLLEQVAQIRNRYRQAGAKVAEPPNLALNPATTLAFLELSPRDWRVTKKAIRQASQYLLVQGIPPGLPANLLQESIRLHLGTAVPSQAQPGAVNLLLATFHDQANLTIDPEATKRQAERAVQAIEPVTVPIQQGEVIVRAGEPISQANFVLLDGFGLSRRSINWLGLGASGLLVVGSIGGFCLVARRFRRSLRRRDHILLWLLSLSVPLLAIANLPYTNLPAIGFLTSSFYGPALAVTQVVLLTGLEGFAAENVAWDYLLAGAAGGLLAAAIAGRLRSRDELAFLGGGIGLVQGGVYFLVQIVFSASAGTIWYALLPGALLYGLAGLGWSVVALGISPYLERLFDAITPIRLVELSNPNCPLLKRLATETPGTFQHTLFVACLAETAGRALHCNVELIRAGTLYHDIGKMHDPLAFIENQMGMPNKHDEIDDPWQSAQIVKKHVSEGLVMARKYGLPKVIRDFIPEHQGTLTISYFYYQAKQRAEKEDGLTVDERDFCYDGPIPQSRETGIVMLADGCEAALRSLKEATPEMALATVQKIFKARWREGQLQDSGLRYEELPTIAEVFVRVWQQFHHQRIAYPKAALEPQVK